MGSISVHSYSVSSDGRERKGLSAGSEPARKESIFVEPDILLRKRIFYNARVYFVRAADILSKELTISCLTLCKKIA